MNDREEIERLRGMIALLQRHTREQHVVVLDMIRRMAALGMMLAAGILLLGVSHLLSVLHRIGVL